MIIIKKLNEVHAFIDGDSASELFGLSDYFSFKVPGSIWSPAYKSGKWDGRIRLYSIKTKKLYIGLIPTLLKYCDNTGIEYKLENFNDGNEFKNFDYKEFIKELNLPFEPRDYQTKGLEKFIKKKRVLLVSPTASGKSLIIYMIIRFALKHIISFKNREKILLIVPRVSLVEQMEGDFTEYGWNAAPQYIHKIYGGKEKTTSKPIIISTWQSLQKIGKTANFWKSIKTIIVDEAHSVSTSEGSDTAAVKVLTRILESCINSDYRVGTTGTVKDSKISDLQLVGLLGQKTTLVTSKQLIDSGHISKIKIRIIKLKYRTKFNSNYIKEQKLITENRERNLLISKILFKKCKKTTIVLYKNISHGKELFKLVNKIMEKYPQTKRPVFLINGSTHVKKREEIRKFASENKNNDTIIIASYGVYAEGVNIPSVENVIFASPYKSKIKVLQSIGRGLRLSKNKDILYVYDISDLLKYGKRHLMERMKIYNKEKFPYSITQINLKKS